MCIHPAAYWIDKSSDQSTLRTKRRQKVEIVLGELRVVLADQQPLHERNIRLDSGITFEQFVGFLNARVFFWPGNAKRPNQHGQRHFSRYIEESPSIIRVDTRELLAANGALQPEFCKFNSGSPRISNRHASPRGQSTFLPASEAPYSAGKAIELTFSGDVRLPPSTTVTRLTMGPSTPLTSFAT
jgi:hypothetical protein